MTLEQKKNLLTKSIWTYKEVKDYLNIKTDYAWQEFNNCVKEKTNFTRKVYRDEVMRIIGTSAEREIDLITKTEGKQNER